MDKRVVKKNKQLKDILYILIWGVRKENVVKTK